MLALKNALEMNNSSDMFAFVSIRSQTLKNRYTKADEA